EHRSSPRSGRRGYERAGVNVALGDDAIERRLHDEVSFERAKGLDLRLLGARVPFGDLDLLLRYSALQSACGFSEALCGVLGRRVARLGFETAGAKLGRLEPREELSFAHMASTIDANQRDESAHTRKNRDVFKW